jgi:CheY-specific phosphatase CheX/CheY-like chemotaxis protein
MSPTVLIAHSDPQVQQRLSTLLCKLVPQCQIQKVSSIQEACDELSTGPYDLVIVTYGLETCDGLKILSYLEDVPTSDWPKAVLAIADVVDRGYLAIEIPNLTFLASHWSDKDFSSALFAIFKIKSQAAQSSGTDSGFIVPFLDATKNVLSVMCQTEAERESIKFERNQTIKDITGLITVSSPHFYGSLAISFEAKCFLGVISRMFGEEYNTITDDVKDAVAEICNQVFGQAKTKLNELGHEISMAIPQVVTDQIAPHAIEGQALSVRFKTPEGHFVVETVIR